MKRQFTLVEVLIAMGVCVVGVCSIMALFPVGISASRDASMAGLASNTADQLLHLVKAIIVNEANTEAQAATNFQTLTGFADMYDTSTYTSTVKPGDSAEPAADDGWQEIDSASPAFAQLLNTFLASTDLSIRTCASNGVYKVTKGQYDDLECVVRVWVEPIEITVPTSKTGVACLPRSARFHAEVSWPAQKSYAKRQTAEYTLDVYCQKRD